MIVELKNLTKVFPARKNKSGFHTHKGDFVHAVNNVTLTVPDGALVSLLGPSGCGKSTTLDMICGLTEPTSGQILFDSKDVTALPPEKRGVGMVFQNYALYPHMTVLQNIKFPLENFKGVERLSRSEIERRAVEAAKLVQIDGFLERKPANLSGGQQQRVAIARALVKMPEVLLLDEPLSNLDARLRLQTREEIRRIQKETGITTVFVTHDQEEAMSISDFIVVMSEGTVQQMGKPQDVYDDPINLFVAKFLGSPQINLFNGTVLNGNVTIGNDKLISADLPDGEVTVGIRPEGLVPDDNGQLECIFERTEILGRDVSVLSKHSSGVSEIIRSISSIRPAKNTGDPIRFAVDLEKTFLFDKKDGKRLL